MEILRTELHCHNEFSNFHTGDWDTPYDCNVTIPQQMEHAHALGLDVLFVTNHNTLDGYRQLLEYRNNHEKFSNIQIYPAEEVTIDDGSHVIAYGITRPIRAGLSFEETLDEIKKQDGVSSAPHPFSLIDAVRDRAQGCDLIEVFNSNNVDVFANAKAAVFAKEHRIAGIAGSDSHVLSTLGRCINTIESEDSLDDILFSMRKNRIEIETTGYASASETIGHLRYKAESSPEFIYEYLSEFYPRSKRIFFLLHKIFQARPESYLWVLLYRLGVMAMKRISKRINFEGRDPEFLKNRDLGTIIKMTI